MDSFDWKKVGESADKVQSLLAKQDPVALKTSYKQLFKAIYVSELNDMGERELRFVLNDGEETIIHSQPSYPGGVPAEKCIDSKKMGWSTLFNEFQ